MGCATSIDRNKSSRNIQDICSNYQQLLCDDVENSNLEKLTNDYEDVGEFLFENSKHASLNFVIPMIKNGNIEMLEFWYNQRLFIELNVPDLAFFIMRSEHYKSMFNWFLEKNLIRSEHYQFFNYAIKFGRFDLAEDIIVKKSLCLKAKNSDDNTLLCVCNYAPTSFIKKYGYEMNKTSKINRGFLIKVRRSEVISILINIIDQTKNDELSLESITDT